MDRLSRIVADAKLAPPAGSGDMHWFTVLFITSLLTHLAVSTWLANRQIRSVQQHRRSVPADFADAVSTAEHARAADYTIARQRCGILESCYDTAILAWLTVGGGIAVAGNLARTLAATPLIGGTLQVLIVAAALAVLALPFSIYRQFSIEQRFGFNRTTPALFVADHARGWLLGLVLGGIIVVVVLYIMQWSGHGWWLLAWGAWIALSLIATLIWPRFIAPLFNRFTRLEDAALQRGIDDLVKRCGFSTNGVFVMDGSRRSAHGNAYFTGLGREKRIVFFDTLLSALTPSQIISVLAHELAHFKLRHVAQRLAVMAMVSLAGFALLGWLSRKDWFYSSLGVNQPSDAAALLLFSLASPAFSWIVAPLMAAWSRRHEFQADDFAASHSDPAELASALVRLYRDNANTLTPDRIYSAFHDSHPPPAIRIQRLRERAAVQARAGIAM